MLLQSGRGFRAGTPKRSGGDQKSNFLNTKLIMSLEILDTIGNGIRQAGDFVKGAWDDWTGKSGVDAQKEINEKNLQFSKEMYDRQRADALSDWNMNNSYNSPYQQMQRLREAGLNPNLVYGKGAENTAAMVRSSQVTRPDLKAAFNQKGGPLGVLSDFSMQARMNKSQVDNLNANAALTEQKAITEGIEQMKRLNEANLKGFDLDFKQKMRKTLEEKLIAQTGILSDEDSARGNLLQLRGELMQSQKELQGKSIQQIGQHIANMVTDQSVKEQILKNLKTQGDILESEMRVYDMFPKGSYEWFGGLLRLLLRK